MFNSLIVCDMVSYHNKCRSSSRRCYFCFSPIDLTLQLVISVLPLSGALHHDPASRRLPPQSSAVKCSNMTFILLQLGIHCWC